MIKNILNYYKQEEWNNFFEEKKIPPSPNIIEKRFSKNRREEMNEVQIDLKFNNFDVGHKFIFLQYEEV
jgi:hypothetical protein